MPASESQVRTEQPTDSGPPVSRSCFRLKIFSSVNLIYDSSQFNSSIFVSKQLKTPPSEDLQDGGGVRRGDHLPPHKYIENTSTCGTTPTEHLLNAGRRPQTSQKARNSPHTWVGQKKKGKTETKNRDGTCTSGREL